ncbi:MAG: hypothetical protein O3A00_20585 [Planctomycetota bacterium]|nr:hypothetical protein [Planctomycetota bacterium]
MDLLSVRIRGGSRNSGNGCADSSGGVIYLDLSHATRKSPINPGGLDGLGRRLTNRGQARF